MLVEVVETVAVSERILAGNEGGERGESKRVREVRVRWRCAGEPSCQTNVCLSVPLGRHVSAAAD